MKPKHFSYPAPDRRAVGGPQVSAYRLPPDVEPIEDGESAPMRWLQDRHIAECDRAAACKGLEIGVAVGALVLAVKRALLGGDGAAAPRSGPGAPESFPRLRRVPLYRRARALQFKRSLGR